MELARKDGIEFHFQTTPVEIIGDGKVTALRCKQIDGTEIEIPCDQVIKAIGQTKTTRFFTDICGLDVDEKGRVAVNENMETPDPKYLPEETARTAAKKQSMPRKWASTLRRESISV
jgi:thioredoxin reductase